MQNVIECYTTETTAQILSNYYYCSVVSRENIFQEYRLITTSSYVNRCLTFFFVSCFICVSTILFLIHLSSPFHEEGAIWSPWAVSRLQALVCIQQTLAIIQRTPVSSFKACFWLSAKSLKQFLNQSFTSPSTPVSHHVCSPFHNMLVFLKQQ